MVTGTAVALAGEAEGVKHLKAITACLGGHDSPVNPATNVTAMWGAASHLLNMRGQAPRRLAGGAPHRPAVSHPPPGDRTHRILVRSTEYLLVNYRRR